MLTLPNIIYDAGALIAAESGRREFLAMHREILAAEIDPIVPDVVLARTCANSPTQWARRSFCVPRSCHRRSHPGLSGRAQLLLVIKKVAHGADSPVWGEALGKQRHPLVTA